MKLIDFNLPEPDKTHLLQWEKTIECRLNKWKFEQASDGDICILHSGEQFRIVRKLNFENFSELFKYFGYQRITPNANSNEEGAVLCYRFYTPTEELEYGVVGIEFERIIED